VAAAKLEPDLTDAIRAVVANPTAAVFDMLQSDPTYCFAINSRPLQIATKTELLFEG
jgi:hypothetical protein